MTVQDPDADLSPSNRRGTDRKKLIIDVRFDGGDGTGIANTRDIGIGGLYMTTTAILDDWESSSLERLGGLSLQRLSEMTCSAFRPVAVRTAVTPHPPLSPLYSLTQQKGKSAYVDMTEEQIQQLLTVLEKGRLGQCVPCLFNPLKQEMQK